MKSVGIDIGGTHIRCAIYDKEFNQVEHFKVANNREWTAADNLSQVVKFLEDMIVEKGYKFRSIGVGAPGPLSTRTGTIINPPNLNETWHNFSIVDFFEKETGFKTTLNNDANLAGLAEATLGAGTQYKTVFYITMSTGIGGGYIREKKIINGSNSAAAEIYNLIVNEQSERRGGVNPGAINEQCSGTGIALISKKKYGKELNSKEVFDLYRIGDPTASDIVEQVVDGIARAIGNISCIVDPDVFVLGGAIALHNPDLVERITLRAKQYVIFPDYLRVELAEFGDNAGLMGAALLP